jgi:hypothetical protein
MIIFPSPFGSLPLLSRDFAGAAVERQIGDVEEVSHYRILYYASLNLQYSSAADGLGLQQMEAHAVAATSSPPHCGAASDRMPPR